MTSLWLLIGLGQVAWADNNQPGLAHIGDLTGPKPLLSELPYKFAKPQHKAIALYERMRAWSNAAVFNLIDAESDRDRFATAIKFANERGLSWSGSYPKDPVIVPINYRSLIDELTGRSWFQPVGDFRVSPFKELPEVFLSRNSGDTNQIISIAIGWIRWSSFRTSSSDDGIHDKDTCDPRADWPNFQCLEKVGEDKYVIKMKPGHRGWSIYAAGSALGGVRDRKTNALPTGNVKSYFEWLAGKEASEALRDYFVVVPYKEVRDRRTVTFKFYLPEKSEPISSPADADPLPRDDRRAESGGPRNVCGVSAACPNYLVPPERRDELNRALDRAGIR